MKYFLIASSFVLFGCSMPKQTPELRSKDELQCRKNVSKIATTNNLMPFDTRALMDLCVPWANQA